MSLDDPEPTLGAPGDSGKHSRSEAAGVAKRERAAAAAADIEMTLGETLCNTSPVEELRSKPAADVPELKEGLVLRGRYELRRLIGRGGMGVVWQAHDSEMRRMVALKFLSSRLSSDLEAMDRIRSEAEVLLTLSHPHIVRLYNLERDGELRFLVMEFLEGGTLAELLIERRAQKRALSAGEVRWVLAQVADALDHAHGQGITHRDIKPGNLMLTRKVTGQLDASNSEVKVTDFGVAFVATSTLSMGDGGFSTTGTLAFMSPEALDGRPPARASDIYGLGATLYMLATSRLPFSSGDVPGQIRTRMPDPIGTQDQRLEDAVMAAMAKAREHRPRSCAEFLEWTTQGLPRGYAGPRPARALEPVARRRRKRLVLVGAAIGVLAIAAIALAQLGGEDEAQAATRDTTRGTTHDAARDTTRDTTRPSATERDDVPEPVSLRDEGLDAPAVAEPLVATVDSQHAAPTHAEVGTPPQASADAGSESSVAPPSAAQSSVVQSNVAQSNVAQSNVATSDDSTSKRAVAPAPVAVAPVNAAAGPTELSAQLPVEAAGGPAAAPEPSHAVKAALAPPRIAELFVDERPLPLLAPAVRAAAGELRGIAHLALAESNAKLTLVGAGLDRVQASLTPRAAAAPARSPRAVAPARASDERIDWSLASLTAGNYSLSVVFAERSLASIELRILGPIAAPTFDPAPGSSVRPVDRLVMRVADAAWIRRVECNEREVPLDASAQQWDLGDFGGATRNAEYRIRIEDAAGQQREATAFYSVDATPPTLAESVACAVEAGASRTLRLRFTEPVARVAGGAAAEPDDEIELEVSAPLVPAQASSGAAGISVRDAVGNETSLSLADLGVSWLPAGCRAASTSTLSASGWCQRVVHEPTQLPFVLVEGGTSGFYLCERPTTYTEFKAYAAQTGLKTPEPPKRTRKMGASGTSTVASGSAPVRYWGDPNGSGREPKAQESVRMVSFADARSFCAHHGFALPSDADLQAAASATGAIPVRGNELSEWCTRASGVAVWSWPARGKSAAPSSSDGTPSAALGFRPRLK